MCGCSGGGSLARVAMRKDKPCKGIKQYDASFNAMLTYPNWRVEKDFDAFIPDYPLQCSKGLVLSRRVLRKKLALLVSFHIHVRGELDRCCRGSFATLLRHRIHTRSRSVFSRLYDVDQFH